MIYPEREQKLSSLSNQEWGDLILVLFSFYRYLETQNNPLGFDDKLLENRILKLSFDTIKWQVIKDHESYQSRCKTNKENWVKWGRKPKVEANPKEPKETQKNPLGYFEKKPSISISNSISILLEVIKKYNNWIIDWKQEEQRRYWKLLLDKINKIDSVANWKYSAEWLLEIILEIVGKNEFHSHKIVWPKKIFYELAGLMAVCKQELQKQEKYKIPYAPWV